jgi:hypothetical protein
VSERPVAGTRPPVAGADVSDPVEASSIAILIVLTGPPRPYRACPEDSDASYSFLEAVFSFLFGDAPPGPSEQDHWKVIARAIYDQKGVVLAEEIRPLLKDVGPSPEEG